MHDVSLTPKNKDPKSGAAAGGLLVLQGTVKTYRYLEEDESAEAKAANAKSASGKAPAKPAKTGGHK
jgi:type IV pilus assembly protein PilO